jgi:hypothetical protein
LVSRIDLILVWVDTGELVSKHGDVPLEEFADLV